MGPTEEGPVVKKERLTRNQKKRLNRKVNKRNGEIKSDVKTEDYDFVRKEDPAEDVEIEYVIPDKPPISEDDPNFEEFSRVFAHFANAGETETEEYAYEEEEATEAKDVYVELKKHEQEQAMASGVPRLSRKKARKLNRLTMAELKCLVEFPETVEAHDANAADPRTLLYFKNYPHSVPVPRHWCQRRKYLQGKRGLEKSNFELPDFIVRTGITEMRVTVQLEDEKKKLKSRTREKTQPRMGKLNVDYQVLHDAFFKYQTKPRMTLHGDLYYEGKEFEVQAKSKRPGDLSNELRDALGMTSPLMPPPWLINMQRFGPPPAYPHLRIPGLNCPIPQGAQWGYHPGGWGKPPLNEHGHPLYGDVFGVTQTHKIVMRPPGIPENPEERWWGEEEEAFEEEEEAEEEAESEEEEEEAMGEPEPEQDAKEMSVEAKEKETEEEVVFSSAKRAPGPFELRKPRKEDVEESERELFKTISEKSTSVDGLFGVDKTYVIPAAPGTLPSTKGKERVHTLSKQKDESPVDVALDPAELSTLDEEALRSKYEKSIAGQRQVVTEDVSSVVAERERKRKRKEKGDDKKKKSKKDFKF